MIDQTLRVLLVEDSDDDARLLIREIEKAGYRVSWSRVETEAGMRTALGGDAWDLVIADYNMPQFSAPAAIRLLKDAGSDVPLLVISGSVAEEEGVETMRAGAHDYLVKNRLGRLAPVIDRELEQAAQRRARRTAEEQYRLLFENSPQPMWVVDRDTLLFLAVNEAAIAHYGYSREEFLGMNLADVRPPGDVPALLAALPAVAEGLHKKEVWRHRRRDGTVIEVEVTTHGLVFTGRPAFLALVNDITDRRRAEQALRASEERFRELIDFSPMGIFETTPGGRFLSANAAFATILGYSSPDEVLLLRADDLYFEGPERDRVLGERDRLLSGKVSSGRIHAFETRLRRKDGSPVWVRGDVRSVFDAAGGIQRFEVFVVDVTEQRRALKALQGSEARYRALIENAMDAIYVSNPQGVVLEVNRATEDLQDRRRSEIVGHPILDFVAPEEREAVGQGFRETISSGSLRGLETLALRADGTKVPIEVSASRVDIGDSYVVHAIVRDVSERRALAEQFRLAQKMEAVGQLAGGVAHDFNNLLTAILGYSQLLAADLRDNQDHFTAIEEIRKAGERAAGLTRQLLAFSRRQILEPRIIDLNDVVQHILAMLSRLIGEDIMVSVTLSPDLGSVRADVGQVEQVIMNLAVNARDAMPRGGRLTIETANVDLQDFYAQTHVHVKPGRYVMLAVSDTGMGMDEATRNRIFEPFFTTKEKGRGTGLGLSTTYGIVKQSGGYIWVYSEVGKGTTFKVYLPGLDSPAETLPLPEPAGGPSAGNETILLVEDEDAV
ncbi:MAG TPA: PAS domain S-box protein, partial [Thermoanaerobaculia bacterium]|nr:PAS domain S-box protein [Thermoanaerobaculia bacterium]